MGIRLREPRLPGSVSSSAVSTMALQLLPTVAGRVISCLIATNRSTS